MYNNFIFDLYGTLIDIRTDEWSKATWKKYAGWLKTEGIRYSARKVKKRYDELIGRQIEELKKQNKHEYPEPDVIPVLLRYAGISDRIIRMKKFIKLQSSSESYQRNLLNFIPIH